MVSNVAGPKWRSLNLASSERTRRHCLIKLWSVKPLAQAKSKALSKAMQPTSMCVTTLNNVSIWSSRPSGSLCQHVHRAWSLRLISSTSCRAHRLSPRAHSRRRSEAPISQRSRGQRPMELPGLQDWRALHVPSSMTSPSRPSGPCLSLTLLSSWRGKTLIVTITCTRQLTGFHRPIRAHSRTSFSQEVRTSSSTIRCRISLTLFRLSKLARQAPLAIQTREELLREVVSMRAIRSLASTLLLVTRLIAFPQCLILSMSSIAVMQRILSLEIKAWFTRTT